MGFHGDQFAFRDQTLAHAFYPTRHPLGGDLHYNTRKRFSATEPPPSDSKCDFNTSLTDLTTRGFATNCMNYHKESTVKPHLKTTSILRPPQY